MAEEKKNWNVWSFDLISFFPATPPFLLITSTAVHKLPWALYQKAINIVSYWLTNWQTTATETRIKAIKQKIHSAWLITHCFLKMYFYFLTAFDPKPTDKYCSPFKLRKCIHLWNDIYSLLMPPQWLKYKAEQLWIVVTINSPHAPFNYIFKMFVTSNTCKYIYGQHKTLSLTVLERF